MIRQGRKHLTLIRMTPDLIYDQLIGMGCVDKLIFSWGGNPGVGSLHRLRDAVENGWPQPLEIEEHSHAAMANAYEAGAAGLPFAVFRGYKGVDLPKVNPNIKRVTCPFTGEVLAAVPALRPDVAVIHALRADRDGNVLLEGIVGVQKEAVLAAKRSVVTVEEIVDDLGAAQPNAVILPPWTVGRDRRGAGRRVSVLRARLLHARQRLLQGMGRDRARARYVPRLDGEQRAGERPRGLRRVCAQASRGGGVSEHHGRLHADRDDDHRRGARAAERRRLLRRHRRAVGGLQPRAADPCAGHHADLRIRHASTPSRTCCRSRSATANFARRR